MKGLRKKINQFRENQREIKKRQSQRNKLIGWFFIEILVCIVVVILIMQYLNAAFNPSERELVEQAKAFNPSVFLAIALAMVGYVKINKTHSAPVALGALFSILLAVSSQAFTLVPHDIDIPGSGELGETAIYFPMIFMFVSTIGVAINLVWVVLESVGSNPDSESQSKS